ncbi:MAG TPA: hypothetical protein VMQ10_07795 [Spirochaetia bacterium]|nr:hypothetical protein [Spirochaetia bacterium]
MKKRPSQEDWLPLSRPQKGAAELPTGAAFRPEWIDFEHGIRVGNLEPHERITQILKYGLEQRHAVKFVTDRWGRGVYWQWICWLPRPNREAKPISSGTNFGCAKLFISLDRGSRTFQCGMTVERGYVRGRPSIPGILLKKDWDWHRLITQCAAGMPLDSELKRLVLREGFTASVTGARGTVRFTRKSFKGAAQIRSAARSAPPADWAGFSLFYPMPEKEIRSSSGYDLVRGILGAFAEVTPAMNLCMQVPLSLAPDGRLLQEQGRR